MIIKNGLVLTGDFTVAHLDMELRGDRIVRLSPPGSLAAETDEEVLDADGLYVLPGLVDIHTHGAMNHDWCDGEEKAGRRMLAFYASRGVTSVLATTMSYSEKILRASLTAMKPLFNADGYGAVLRGVNMEGPFLNHAKRGAQNPAYLTNPALHMFQELNRVSGGHIRLVDLAPELENAPDFIQAVSGECTVSLAHTTAGYETAVKAFQKGASHVTHLFNGMSPYNHRDPGVVGAAMDYADQVEIIADGHHLHPAVVRGMFRLFGENRICLISDSMRATGMPEGAYSLGGQAVMLSNGKATLKDGSLAGSATDLAACCRRAISFGVPLEQAVRGASFNPARAVGLDEEIGRVAPGLRADLLFWDPDYHTKQVVVGGNCVFSDSFF